MDGSETNYAIPNAIRVCFRVTWYKYENTVNRVQVLCRDTE